MAILGVVSEFNPFHKGHQYLLQESRSRLGGDTTVICVMSGDFVQRGEAACFDKFSRAEAACRSGADLVIELPLPWCISSAEGFARGAVALLAALGCTHLSFGSESGDLTGLQRVADALGDPTIHEAIQSILSADPTLPYARARQMALAKSLGDDALLLEEPNNILGIEYMKAIRSLGCDLTPMTIQRFGAAHDAVSAGVQPSAMQLRRMLLEGEQLDESIPSEAMQVFWKEIEKGRSWNPRLLDRMLRSRLYTLNAEDFEMLPDSGDGAGRRLYKALQEGKSLEDTAALAATKRYTRARMRRMLLCAALGIRKEDLEALPPYVRLLAINEKGRTFLHENSVDIALPIVTKPAMARDLGKTADHVFSMGASAHDLYCLQFMTNSVICMSEDWKHGTVLVKNC